MGWLSPLVLNFAWFANLFYWYGALSILAGKRPEVSAIIAVLLSLDTFRYSRHLLNEGGATTPVYGYGWGAYAWIISILLLLIAAGLRQIESSSEEEGNNWRTAWKQGPLMVIGIALTIAIVTVTTYFAISDRISANESETQRLSKVAFKRGDVCTVTDPEILNPINGFTGPLEIKLSDSSLHANYPFAQIETLLKWGIPSIRIGNQDYSIAPNRDDELISNEAVGPAQAVLEVTEEYGKSIQVRLIENVSQRTVFDFTWQRQNYPVNTNIWCPEYKSFPSSDDLTRKLLIDALGSFKNKPEQLSRDKGTQNIKPAYKNIIDGTIVGNSKGGLTRKMRNEQWRQSTKDRADRFHHVFNINCPRHIGWDGDGYDASTNTGWPFRIGDKVYYPGRARRSYFSTCEEDAIYIYSGFSSKKEYRLNIQKRNNKDFNLQWRSIIVIKDIPSVGNDAYYIEHVEDKANVTEIKLVDKKNGDIFNIEAPLNH
jgi:hypothetical protein